ncbi:hypothetical protein [Paludisphaera mucosa]|uniref:Uncharacterized protein n=1 Tax=Paludisphaera mucosa TaxID=3030827 RepID=A0ABT6F4P9_9BACT|nr:hypothetical protein [Paludisphaera mucosa]MDG3002556.1 hypothetical protein [Paludisphaera mucosa]
MSTLSNKIARGITRFVDSPVTKLVKGVALLVIGLSEASRSFADDLVQKQLRVGHGLVIIGVFGILEALPHFIDSLEASRDYLQRRGGGAGPADDGREDRRS